MQVVTLRIVAKRTVRLAPTHTEHETKILMSQELMIIFKPKRIAAAGMMFTILYDSIAKILWLYIINPPKTYWILIRLYLRFFTVIQLIKIYVMYN